MAFGGALHGEAHGHAGLDGLLPSCINIHVDVCGPGKRPQRQPGMGVQLTMSLLTPSPLQPPPPQKASMHPRTAPTFTPWGSGPRASTRAVPEDRLLTCMGVHSRDPHLGNIYCKSRQVSAPAVIALHAPARQPKPVAVNPCQGGTQQMLSQCCQNKGGDAVPPPCLPLPDLEQHRGRGRRCPGCAGC